MEKNTVLVLASPTEPQLAMLATLPEKTVIVVGEQPEAFERSAAEANVFLTGPARKSFWNKFGEWRRESNGCIRGRRVSTGSFFQRSSRVPSP